MVDGKSLDDTELLTILTLSLPEWCEPLVMALQSRSDLITFDIMAGTLLQESARRHVGQVTHKALESNSTAGSNMAFTANRPMANQRFSPGRVSFSPGRVSFSPGRVSFPVNGRGRGGSRGGFRGHYGASSGGSIYRGNPTSSRIRPTLGSRCHYCGKEAHWKRDRYKRKAEEGSSGKGTSDKGDKRGFTFLAKVPAESVPVGWIIDSGASQHLCGDRALFTTYNIMSENQEITIPDGTKIEAKGIGEIAIATEGQSITLRDLWHVPEIGENLMSVSRMVDAGYTVEFGPTACIIRKGGTQSELGQRQGRLYHLVSKRSIAEEEDQRVEANLGLTSN